MSKKQTNSKQSFFQREKKRSVINTQKESSWETSAKELSKPLELLMTTTSSLETGSLTEPINRQGHSLEGMSSNNRLEENINDKLSDNLLYDWDDITQSKEDPKLFHKENYDQSKPYQKAEPDNSKENSEELMDGWFGYASEAMPERITDRDTTEFDDVDSDNEHETVSVKRQNFPKTLTYAEKNNEERNADSSAPIEKQYVNNIEHKKNATETYNYNKNEILPHYTLTTDSIISEDTYQHIFSNQVDVESNDLTGNKTVNKNDTSDVFVVDALNTDIKVDFTNNKNENSNILTKNEGKQNFDTLTESRHFDYTATNNSMEDIFSELDQSFRKNDIHAFYDSFKKGEAINKGNAFLYNKTATYLSKWGAFELSARVLCEGISATNGDFDLSLALVYNYYQRGLFEDARNISNSLIEIFVNSHEHLNKIIAASIVFADIWWVYSRIHAVKPMFSTEEHYNQIEAKLSSYMSGYEKYFLKTIAYGDMLAVDIPLKVIEGYLNLLSETDDKVLRNYYIKCIKEHLKIFLSKDENIDATKNKEVNREERDSTNLSFREPLD